MLRYFENIWSKSLVNSDEFAMFAAPNNQISGKSCIDFLKHRNIAGFLDCIFLRRYGCLATQDRGSASSFIEKLLIKFLVSQMPNNTKDLKPRDNSTLSSTQPSEKGKSQSKLEKEIESIRRKVATLQAECKAHEAEKYRLLCYIDRYCSCLLSNFLENNPLDSRDWKKLHKQQLDIREAIK